MAGPIIYPSTGSAGRPQVFGSGPNAFQPPGESFPTRGPALNPTINTSVSSGGNVADATGKAQAFVPPLGQSTEKFKSKTPVTPVTGTPVRLGRDVTDTPVEGFKSGTPVTPTADQPEELGKGPLPAPPPPFVFGSGQPVTPSTNDPEVV